ncbi:MAG TPA: endo-1,4-beta-xylanase [Rhizomicrobium sp.]|jgi:endo-1,4-beta-xylanase|nr:endo-1,4-beta-xylanase [Rhizomicrobium sp.]
MLTRRLALAGLGAAACAVPAATQILRPALTDEGPSLRALAAARGLVFGCATGNYQLREPDFAFAFLRDCAMLVPEYELKRDLTEPIRGRTDFSAADALLAFAQQHGLLFRGHPLLWFDSNPPWLEAAVAAAKDETVFTTFIHAAAGHYRGHAHSWDVVNEAIEPKDGRSDGLRASFWLKKFGPSYIDAAFAAARDADPAALLVYNEYGLEEDGAEHDARRRATLKLLEGLIARGAPVGALGLQGHLSAFGETLNQKKLAAFLDAVRATGLRILVTEHDVDDSGGTLGRAARDAAVADASRRFLDVALDNRATMALLTWGLSDRFLDAEGVRNTLLRGAPRKLPLDAALQPTAMRDAIAQALAGARRR